MYNAIVASLNAQININTTMNRKVKYENSLVTSCLTFKGYVLTKETIGKISI